MQYLISDVHGNKEKLTDLISHSKTEHITLLGDVGFGFGIDMYFFKQYKFNVRLHLCCFG